MSRRSEPALDARLPLRVRPSVASNGQRLRGRETRLVAVLVVMTAFAMGAPARAADNLFNGTVSSDWNTAANWSLGKVPTELDDVVIPSGKSATLSSGTDGVASSFTLDGSLTVDGRTLTAGAGSSSIASSLTVKNGSTLNLGATTTWSSGSIIFGTGTNRINIDAGDVLDITGDVTAGGGDGTNLWRNEGTLNRTTSTGTASINQAFENDGTVNVDAGTLNLARGDGSGTSAGDYTVAAAGTLQFSNAFPSDGPVSIDITGSDASVTGPGRVRQSNATTVVGGGARFDVGTLDFGPLGGTLQLDSDGKTQALTSSSNTGIRSGVGTLTVDNTTTFGPAFVSLKLDGPGTTTLGGTATLATSGSMTVSNGHTLNLPPTTTWSSGAVHLGGGTVNIGPGDVLDITGDVTSSTAGGSGSSLWRNEGTVNRRTSSGTVTINHPFENDGSVNVNTGTLNLACGDGPGQSSGDYVVAAPAALGFTSCSTPPTIDVVGVDASITGPGTVRVGGNTTTVVGGGASFDVGTLDFSSANGTLQLDSDGSADMLTAPASGGTRSGIGTLTVDNETTVGPNFVSLRFDGTGATTLNGTATVATTSSGSMRVTNGHTLNLPRTTAWSSGNIPLGGGTINIGPSDVLNITGVSSSGTAGGTGANLWHNEGTVNRTTSTGSVGFDAPFTSSGNINVDSGTMTFFGGLTQTAGVTEVDAGATIGGAVVLQGGTLKGQGTASGAVKNTGGTVKPGASPGKLTLGGNYTQGSGGTLEAEISGTGQGTEHDWLAVGGNASLDGTLAVVSDPAFTSSGTDTFAVLTAGGSVTGTFASLVGADTPFGTYSPAYTAGPPGAVTLGFAAADDDGDGVPNADDECPDTPSGEPPDAKGCSASQRGTSGSATQTLSLTIEDLPEGVLAVSVANASVSFGSLEAGGIARADIGDVIYENTLGSGANWSAAVAATSFISGTAVVPFSGMSFTPGSQITGGTSGTAMPGSGGGFTGADTTPGTTFSDPITTATAPGGAQGTFTHAGSTASVQPPADADAGTYTGTLQYTITG
jgi:hypothetical protein